MLRYVTPYSSVLICNLDFWENTKEPTLKKFLDFRLGSGDLGDMQTEHNSYNNELKTISSRHAKVSEIGEKVKKWKQAFKALFIFNYFIFFAPKDRSTLVPHQLPYYLLVSNGKDCLFVGVHIFQWCVVRIV